MNTRSATHRTARGVLLRAARLATGAARAELCAEEFVKLAQNPVGSLISLPFQNNTRGQ